MPQLPHPPAEGDQQRLAGCDGEPVDVAELALVGDLPGVEAVDRDIPEASVGVRRGRRRDQDLTGIGEGNGADVHQVRPQHRQVGDLQGGLPRTRRRPPGPSASPAAPASRWGRHRPGAGVSTPRYSRSPATTATRTPSGESVKRGDGTLPGELVGTDPLPAGVTGGRDPIHLGLRGAVLDDPRLVAAVGEAGLGDGAGLQHRVGAVGLPGGGPSSSA